MDDEVDDQKLYRPGDPEYGTVTIITNQIETWTWDMFYRYGPGVLVVTTTQRVLWWCRCLTWVLLGSKWTKIEKGSE